MATSATEGAAAAAAGADGDDDDLVATLENLSVDDAAALEQASDALKSFMAEGSPAPAAIAEKAIRAQVNAGLPNQTRVSIYCGAAFVEPAAAVFAGTKEGGPIVEVLAEISKTAAQQMVLIASCEAFCALTCPAARAKFPVLLKNCYDADALDEELIMRWYAGPTKYPGQSPAISEEASAALRKSAKPFYEWLKEAEATGSEDESDDDDDDDDDDEGGGAAAAAAPAPAPAPAAAAAEESDGSDSDLDIDDI